MNRSSNESPRELRIEPGPEVLAAARAWLNPVRQALGNDFLAAYITGSALSQGFDPRHSKVNLLVVARSLEPETLDRLREQMPAPKQRPYVDPLFLSEKQILGSLDSFPIEWLDIRERHMLLEGDDMLSNLDVPNTYLRLQCEQELRAKHIRLRQAYLASGRRPLALVEVLKSSASGFATLFRTLLRLRGEPTPASTAQVIERVADLYRLDAEGLLGAHMVRYSGGRQKAPEVLAIYRKFLAEISRLVIAIDTLRVP